MTYRDFLEDFATVQGVADAATLLAEHGDRYSFQIRSRERARQLIESLDDKLGIDFCGLRVLDVGCAYGSFSVEFAKLGAQVVGIDISDKWLGLAESNARDEAHVTFLECDASARRALGKLMKHGPYDMVVLNTVLEHVYDTAGLLHNLRLLLADGARIYYRVPNGLAMRNVLLERHKKIYGISLLAPDFWPIFVKAPFRIYYRRWEYFDALFAHFGFKVEKLLNEICDPDLETTQRRIVDDRDRIRGHLARRNFEDPAQYTALRRAADLYFDEIEADLETLGWWDLFYKYRADYWEGILRV